MSTKVFMQFDFAARRKEPCELCGKPFDEHFQPPPDANPKLAANWCPVVFSSGRKGFSSMNFRRTSKGDTE